MARQGRFGTLPRAASDITAAVISLYETYQNQRDRNIISAWENGSEFEGKKVTDGRILSWFKMRRDEVTKDDPMYDYWNDQYHQTRFAIAEQKANLAYTQEKLSNAGMADFYRKWSRRVPRASAAWRDLMTSSAKFAKAARAQGQANSDAARMKALKERLAVISRNAIQPAYDVLGALVAHGQRTGEFAFSDTNGIPALNWDLSSSASLDEDLAAIQNDPAALAVATREIRQAMPDFDGVLTVPLILDLIGRAQRGYRDSARVAKQAGEDDLAQDYREKGRTLTGIKSQLRVSQRDLPDQYLDLTESLKEDLAESSGPAETVTILDRYAQQGEGMARRFARNGDLTTAGNIRQAVISARGGQQADAESSFTSMPQDPTTDAPTDPLSPAFSNMLRAYAEASHADLDLIGKGGVLVIDVVNGVETKRIIPPDAVGSFAKGSRLATRELPFAGASYTDAEGNVISVSTPSGTMTQAAREMPVMVSIPDATIDQAAIVGPTGRNSLGLVEGRTTRQVGTRTDWGDGVISYGTPSGPGGMMLYSGAAPFIERGVRDFSEKDGVWTAEMDPQWIAETHQAGTLGAILQTIDATSGEELEDFLMDPETLRSGPSAIAPTFDSDEAFRQPRAEPQVFDIPTTPGVERPEGVPQGVWDDMVADVSRGVDPQSAEFRDKYRDQMGAGGNLANGKVFNLAAGRIDTFVNEGRIRVAGLGNQRLSPEQEFTARNAVVPEGSGIPADVWQNMVNDAKAGMTKEELRNKYSPDLVKNAPAGSDVSDVVFRFDSSVDSLLKGVASLPKVGAAPMGPAGADGAVLEPGQAVAPTLPPGEIAQPEAEVIDNNAVFYQALATTPEYIGWVTPTLHLAGRSAESRAAWASSVNPQEFWAKLLKTDPNIRDNPIAQQIALTQIDVLLGAGRAGIAEGEFAQERMITAGVNPMIANGAFIAAQGRARKTPSMMAMFGQQAEGIRRAQSIFGGGVSSDLTNTNAGITPRMPNMGALAGAVPGVPGVPRLPSTMPDMGEDAETEYGVRATLGADVRARALKLPSISRASVKPAAVKAPRIKVKRPRVPNVSVPTVPNIGVEVSNNAPGSVPRARLGGGFVIS